MNCTETLERRAPGVYVCPLKHYHIFLDELLEGNGYDPTPHNIEMMEKSFRLVLRAGIADFDAVVLLKRRKAL
jgi:hypothetical protein